ncbi:MAG: hypothetical protein K6G58_00755 [Lachnospiraceae bacterium]|nr:hypothetical protein [Lachnospiraceae bacterium]
MDDKMNGKIDESLLEGVTGGVIFDASGISGADQNNPWEVLDDTTGNVLGRFKSKNDAVWAAGQIWKNHMEVNWDQVLQLRGQK